MISSRLKAVLLRTLNLPDYDFEPTMLASQVPGWDSLKHLDVIAAVEREYSVRFKTLEVIRLKNIGTCSGWSIPSSSSETQRPADLR